MGPEERAAYWARRREEGREMQEAQLARLRAAFEGGRPRVAINCSFGASMAVRELSSLAKQVQLSYTSVRDLGAGVQLHLTSVDAGNPALRSLEAIGFRSWPMHVHAEPYWEAFRGERLVVLSPDAEEDLEEVEEDCTYVLGGLVDRSVSRMQSAEQARAQGVAAVRRLPLKRHGPLGAHPILNIDVVVRILIERLRRGDDWPGILSDCLPQRHSGQPTARCRRKRNALERKAAQQGAVDPGAALDAATDEGHSESGSDLDAPGSDPSGSGPEEACSSPQTVGLCG
uniref:tRNA (guanine(9)-N(1))-methyltransferase n=1 Tax=Alexandrium catenella TaxID=2925 RepID=A0A7S1Q096_ALECA